MIILTSFIQIISKICQGPSFIFSRTLAYLIQPDQTSSSQKDFYGLACFEEICCKVNNRSVFFPALLSASMFDSTTVLSNTGNPSFCAI